jgi:hypothetical protein
MVDIELVVLAFLVIVGFYRGLYSCSRVLDNPLKTHSSRLVAHNFSAHCEKVYSLSQATVG